MLGKAVKKDTKTVTGRGNPTANRRGEELQQAPWLTVIPECGSVCVQDPGLSQYILSLQPTVAQTPGTCTERRQDSQGERRNFNLNLARTGCQGHGLEGSWSALWECLSGAVQGMERY